MNLTMITKLEIHESIVPVLAVGLWFTTSPVPDPHVVLTSLAAMHPTLFCGGKMKGVRMC